MQLFNKIVGTAVLNLASHKEEVQILSLDYRMRILQWIAQETAWNEDMESNYKQHQLNCKGRETQDFASLLGSRHY